MVIYKRIGALLWLSLAAALVLLAVALSAARLLLPAMSEYRGEIEAAVSEALHHQVRIGSLDAEWRGMSPVLVLNEVHVEGAGAGGSDLVVDKIRVALDPLGSLLQRRWSTRAVYVVGVQASLRRGADGHFSLVGGSADATGDGAPLLQLLLQQPLIGLQQAQVTLIDERQGGARHLFRDVEVLFANDAGRHRFSVQAVPPPAFGRRLRLIGQVDGPLEAPGDLGGRFYVSAEGLRLAAWLDYLPPLPPLAGGVLNAELWVEVEAGEPVRVTGQVDGSEILLSGLVDGPEPVDFGRLGGRFDWKRQGGGWSVIADRVRLGDAEEGDGVGLHAQWDGAARRLRGVLNRLPVAGAAQLAAVLPQTGQAAAGWLDRLQPAGQLHDVDFQLELPRHQAPRLALRARFEDVSIEPVGRQPGFVGLAGDLEGDLSHGRLRLDASRARLMAPALLRRSLPIDYLYGSLEWQRYGDRLRLQTRNLMVRLPDASLAGRVRIDLPASGGSPWLDLQLAMDRMPVAGVPAYLPVGLLPHKTVEWFDAAFRSGEISDLGLLIEGPLDRMPFDHGEGVLAADFDFADTVLAYHPHWGTIRALDGHGHFRGRRMRIVGERGLIQQASVERVVARIDDLAKPVLAITGTASGTLAGMLDYVRSSPLGARFGRLVSGLESEGDAHLTLDLRIPLRHGLGAVRVSGGVDLDGASLGSRKWGFQLSSIRGRLKFSERGLSCQAVRARYDEAPVEINVYAGAEDEQPGTVVEIDGPLPVVERMRAAGWWPAAHLSGSADWRARLFVPARPRAGAPPLRLRLDSDLRGIGLALPQPLGKTPAESREISLEWVPGELADWPLRIRYDGIGAATLGFGASGRLQKAAIHFGDGFVPLPAGREIRLSGRLSRASPIEWGRMFGGGSSPTTLPPLSFDLEVDSLMLGKLRVPSVKLASQAAQPWVFLLTGKGAEGNLRLVFAPQGRLARIEADLAQLSLLRDESADAAASADGATDVLAGFPELRLSISDFRWNGKELGLAALDAERVDTGLAFTRLSLASEAITLEGQGAWLRTDGREFTRLSANIQDGDLGKLLQLAGDDALVDGGRLQGRLELTWPGTPADFSIERLAGELRLEVADGRLKEVRPGAGKLLGLLNLRSIPRRLSLDFSDLFKEGFSFDSMRGTFLLSDGDAFTNDLRIKAPAADIEIAGRTDLVRQEYDELVTVIPHVTSGLPVAGAIAGGPAVGAAVLLAERLLSKQVEKMSRVRYVVTGKWDNPVYRRIDQKPAKRPDEAPED